MARAIHPSKLHLHDAMKYYWNTIAQLSQKVHIFTAAMYKTHMSAHISFTCIQRVLPDWKQPAGRPSHSWVRAIEADLGPLNFGLAAAWRKATTRDDWRHIVDTATLLRSTL